MNRRRFLALCGASVALAGCSAPSKAPGSPTTEAGTSAGSGTSPGESSGSGTAATRLFGSVDGEWSGYRHDAGHTAATDDPGPTDEPATVWQHATATGFPATGPAVGDGAFFVATDANVLYAREAADGSIRWREPLATTVQPVTSGRTVAASGGRSLVGLRTDNGEARWEVTLGDPVTGLAATGERIVAATGTAVVAVAREDGTELWRRPVEGSVATPPGAGDGVVAVGLTAGETVAVDAETGERRFRESVGAEPAFAPAPGDGAVYVGAGSRLVALEAGTGDRRWAYPTGDPVAAAPVPAPDRL
jgi:serine/threonine-protein kinase